MSMRNLPAVGAWTHLTSLNRYYLATFSARWAVAGRSPTVLALQYRNKLNLVPLRSEFVLRLVLDLSGKLGFAQGIGKSGMPYQCEQRGEIN